MSKEGIGIDRLTYAERYSLSEAEEAWRRRAEAFARDEVAPQARSADAEGRFSRELVSALGASGLLGATLPEAFGGGGASRLTGCLIAEEIGAVDGSVRGFLAVQIGLVASVLVDRGSAEQQEAWLPGLIDGSRIGCYALTEPEAGSDVGAIKTRARTDGDEVVLDGEKIWITNGGVADVALVFATTDPEGGHRTIEAFVVPTDTPGFRTEPMPGIELGHRASNHARIRLKDVRVPLTARVGGEGGGFPTAMRALEAGRLNVAAGAVGIHRACLDETVAFARARRQFGRRVGDFQQIGAALADMAVELESSRLLTHHAARLVDRGLDASGAVSAAKLAATEAAQRAATQAVKIQGARAYTNERPVERHYRDVIALTIYEGTSHIQRLILSRRLLGRDEGGKR